LLLNFSSVKDGALCTDETCIVPAGWHPILTKRSFVYFAYAKEVGHLEMDHLVASGRISIHPTKLSVKQIELLRTSVRVSKEIPTKYRRRYAPGPTV